MIDLLTGLPGNAKTLHGLELMIARATAEQRPVYYSGLKEFKNDDPRLNGTQWIEFDPMEWHNVVPSGSLIFIDECQKIFRNRSIGANPPKHVTELEEHRHKGLDFLLISQHPSLVDPAIRRLTQTHRHMVRIFGMEASTVHKWNGTKDNCDKARSDSEKTRWAFNKGLYGLYKSADAHTMKRSIPMRLKMLLAVPVLLAAAGYYVYSTVVKKPVAAPAAVHAGQAVGPDGVAVTAPKAARFDPVEDARSYVEQNTPRVTGLPHTAPKYDEITKPVRAPIPAACIQKGRDTCKCYSQQGTPLYVEFDMCVGFAHQGFFQDFEPERQASQVHGKSEPARSSPGDYSVGNSPSIAVVPDSSSVARTAEHKM